MTHVGTIRGPMFRTDNQARREAEIGAAAARAALGKPPVAAGIPITEVDRTRMDEIVADAVARYRSELIVEPQPTKELQPVAVLDRNEREAGAAMARAILGKK